MSKQHCFPELQNIAIRAVELASCTIAHFDRKKIEICNKGEKDVQTSCDYSAEIGVKKYLAEATPDIPVWGEETGKEFEECSRFWLLDPIDGTVNYIHEIPLYTISLAFIENGVTEIGVIEAPTFNERFWAVKGKGAFCNGNRLSVSSISELNMAILCYGDPDVGSNAKGNNRNYDPFFQKLRPLVMRTRIIGSAALQLAWLAAGKTDISVTWGNLPWDVQAGVLIVREAGGVVMDMDGKDHSLASKYTIACNPYLKEFIKNESKLFAVSSE